MTRKDNINKYTKEELDIMFVEVYKIKYTRDFVMSMLSRGIDAVTAVEQAYFGLVVKIKRIAEDERRRRYMMHACCPENCPFHFSSVGVCSYKQTGGEFNICSMIEEAAQ